MEFDHELEVQDFLGRLQHAWVPGNVVTSFTRTPAENAAVGGDPDSQHLLSLAVDVDGPFLGQLEQNARREGLVPVMEPDHLHIQRYPAGAIAEAIEDQGGPAVTWRGLDVALNEILGGADGQTISARLGRRIREGTATLPERALCRMLDVMDPDHCEKAAERYDEEDEDEECHHHPHRHRKPRAEGCPEEPWWLRPCADEGEDED